MNDKNFKEFYLENADLIRARGNIIIFLNKYMKKVNQKK